MDNFNLYKDIQARTNGEIYIGVVGPVRTGKSTFIKRFMDLLVIPSIEDVYHKERAVDELPQSAAGKTIMTTEPKFIPKEAAKIQVTADTEVAIRLIDCVGYMVDGAAGHIENEKERMVKTPWFDYEIPFTKAAEIGTRKVIAEHSTIGVVITTDGSFGELPRENFINPEEQTIDELKKLGKPFIVLLNSSKPYSSETKKIQTEMMEKYGVTVMPINCEQLRKEDITSIMEQVLLAFPISEINFYIPKWVEMLPQTHWLKSDLLEKTKEILDQCYFIRDMTPQILQVESPYIKQIKIDKVNLENGSIQLNISMNDSYYYNIISDLVGVSIEGEYQLISLMKELVNKKKEYEMVSTAIEEVRQKGYSVVTPQKEDITIDTPELMKHGTKFGVKIKATAPSVHMINAIIKTEIAPIVGTEAQAQDLIQYINESSSNNPEGIWDTNIFGKSIIQLVDDEIQNIVNKLSEESRAKLQDCMKKIVNDNNGRLVCIII